MEKINFMMNDRNKLYEYLIENNYVMNDKSISIYHNVKEYFCKNPIVVIFNDQNILIKDISDNRKYNFDYNQSSKIIIGFLKYLEKTAEKILV